MEEKNTRRDFLKKSGYVAGGVIGSGLLGGVIGSQFQEDESGTNKAGPQHDQALQYFVNKDNFQTLSQATERLFPEDDNGPGAINLGVPYYIDHQLAGLWGNNSKEYMQGPFYKGENQGYQSQLNRNEIFDLGIEALNLQSESKFSENFVSLEEDQQDEILKVFEKDNVDMHGVSSSLFFELLRTATLEGVYADPLYGGNKNMEGWRMKEYPGVHMSYKDKVGSDEFIEMKQASLHDTHN